MINNGNNSGYHAVLMDINMPGLNGIEATKRIRENSDVPVVAISGDSDRESIRRCDEAGMDKCITKPVDFKILVGVLKDIYCKESC
jgi:two-component system sensor histidine kinase RpfC